MHRKSTSKTRSARAGAFTLIELLIVVAIIAILAAIAVPNFLEAQVRSKVSRVLSDIRAYKIGLESYAVDNNSYTDNSNRATNNMARGLRQLTTPIAYLTVGPIDPFYKTMRNTPGRSELNRFYEIWTAKQQLPIWQGNTNPRFWPRNQYLVISLGPDTLDDSSSEHATLDDMRFGMEYDATNGTISVGDIYVTNDKLPYILLELGGLTRDNRLY